MPTIENSTQPAVSKRLNSSWVLAFVVGTAIFVPSADVAAADPATDSIIAECGAIDEGSVIECLALKLEQAETTLHLAEESWQRLHDEGLSSSPEETVPEETVLEETPAEEAPREVTESATVKTQSAEPAADLATDLATDLAIEAVESPSSNVIAIVNDEALQAGVNTGANPVINVDQDTVAEAQVDEDLFDTSVAINERFGFLPALFRSYRDQHCAWQATVFGADRTGSYYRACLVSMTQSRSEQLTHYLATQRSQAKRGKYYRGYYTKIETGALFQSCDRRTNWWVTGAAPILTELDRRYLDIKSQSTANNDLLYAEVRGQVGRASGNGPAANFSTALSVRSVSLLRPVAETDCQYTALPAQNLYTAQDTNSQDSSVSGNAATVDDFAASGFLYGYFNYWLAACSVTENSVCSAETEAQFASDGDWQLRVDRSLEGDWRVKLVPTTDDQLIEKQLTMQINDSDVFLDTTFPEPLNLAMNRGVDIANGELAREVIAKLKRGRELRLQWFDSANVMSELKFSLLGVTRALEYFDSAGP